jgi:uncharacterized membrane protein
VFLAIFVGTGALGVVSAALAVTELGEAASLLRIAGALLYMVGCLVVTGVGNVPRNNALDRLAPESPESEAVWRTYVREWTTWNSVRTVTCILSTAAFTAALAIDS